MLIEEEEKNKISKYSLNSLLLRENWMRNEKKRKEWMGDLREHIGNAFKGARISVLILNMV